MKTVIIIIAIIVGVGITFFFSYQWMGSQLSSYLPQPDSINLEEEGEIEPREFTSPDKKLKLDYTSDWREVKDKKVLEGVFSEEITEKYNIEVIFLAHRIKDKATSHLLISEGFFGDQAGFEEIIDIMKETNQEEDWEMEIIESEIEDNENIFEAIYTKVDLYDLHSKEKIIILEEKTYIVSFMTHDQNWTKMEEDADNIIESVQIINQVVL